MKRLYFIVNIVAGRAVVSKKLGKIIDKFTRAGYEAIVHITQSGEDAKKCAVYACERGFDLLVVAGGDGTLNQCLQGIMSCRKRIPVGYIPAGSTNDFAKSLGIPSDQLKAASLIVRGGPALCDIGRLNDKYFSYIAAFGAFTEVSYETPQMVKNLFGHAAYVFKGAAQFKNIKAKPLRIEFDDKVIEGEFIYGMITNTASVGGILSMKDFYLNDGVFEVTLVKKPNSVTELNNILLAPMKHDTSDKNIVFFRTDKLTVTALSDEPFAWTRDGEYGGNSPVNTIYCKKRAVPFIVKGKSGLPFKKDKI